eukprot:673163_1
MEAQRHFELTVKTEENGQNLSAAFKCEFCTEEFNLKDHLIQHAMHSHQFSIDIVKSEEKSTFGNEVYSQSQSSSTCETQMIEPPTQHCEETKFEYDMCAEYFPTQNDLTAHQLTHNGERLCQSNTPPDEFKSRREMAQQHRSRSEERTFQCTLCEKAFKTKHELTIHR